MDGTRHVDWDEAIEETVDVSPLPLLPGGPFEWVKTFSFDGGRESEELRAPTARSSGDSCGIGKRSRAWCGSPSVGPSPILVRQGGRHGREHHRVEPPRRAPGRGHAAQPDLGPHDAGRRRRALRLPARSARRCRPGGARLPERRGVPGPHRGGRLWCSRRRSSSTTTPRSPPRARATSTTPSRSTRSSPCGCMTLTDGEKSEARGTDPRAAAIIDRCDDMSADTLSAPARADDAGPSPRPVSRTTSRGSKARGVRDHQASRRALVGPRGGRVVRPVDRVGVDRRRGGHEGHPVRLAPSHRADAQDIFLRAWPPPWPACSPTSTVIEHVAVTVDDDPATEELSGKAGICSSTLTRSNRWSTRVRTDDAARAGRRHRQHLPIGRRLRGRGGQLPRRADAATRARGSRTSGSAACTWRMNSSTAYDGLVLIDAVPMGEAPAPWPSSNPARQGGHSEADGDVPVVDAHTMNPEVVLATLRRPGRVGREDLHRRLSTG